MKTTYNKLVRDRIPEIILEDGKRPVTRTAGEAEYAALLEAKLQEELDELAAPGADRVQELADILEVVHALARVESISANELEAVRGKKAAERGGFDERIVLVEVVTDEEAR